MKTEQNRDNEVEIDVKMATARDIQTKRVGNSVVQPTLLYTSCRIFPEENCSSLNILSRAFISGYLGSEARLLNLRTPSTYSEDSVQD